jgi:hypothetical protein
MKLRIGNSRERTDLGKLPDWLLMLALRVKEFKEFGSGARTLLTTSHMMSRILRLYAWPSFSMRV